MPKSIVVHGPAACGKTRNGERLRKAFGMKYLLDEGRMLSPGRQRLPKMDTLILSEEPADKASGLQSIAFHEAMKRIPTGA